MLLDKIRSLFETPTKSEREYGWARVRAATHAHAHAQTLTVRCYGLLDATLEDDSAKGLLVNQAYSLIAQQCIRSTRRMTEIGG